MKKLKLNSLSSKRLSEKEMTNVCGGEGTPTYYYRVSEFGTYLVCACGCQYSDQGGSSNADNGNANYRSGIIPDKLKGGLK